MRGNFTIEELKARSEPAWEKAIKKLAACGQKVLAGKKFTRNWPFNEKDFEEFANDGIVACYKNIGIIKSLEHLKNYFCRSAINAAQMRIREEMAKKRGSGKVLVTESLSGLTDDFSSVKLNDEVIKLRDLDPDTEAQAITAAQDHDFKAILHAASDKLETSDRILIEELCLKKRKHRDVAKMLKIKGVKQIGNMKNQALTRLKKKIPLHLLKEIEKIYGCKQT